MHLQYKKISTALEPVRLSTMHYNSTVDWVKSAFSNDLKFEPDDVVSSVLDYISSVRNSHKRFHDARKLLVKLLKNSQYYYQLCGSFSGLSPDDLVFRSGHNLFDVGFKKNPDDSHKDGTSFSSFVRNTIISMFLPHVESDDLSLADFKQHMLCYATQVPKQGFDCISNFISPVYFDKW